MAAVVKKPPATGRETPTSTPQRPGARASTPTSTPGTTGVQRTRSVRPSTPVSARAAVTQRRESLLGNSTTSAAVKGSSSTDVDREEAIRAEAVAVLEDLKERLEKAETASSQYKRQAEVLQSRLDEALKEQSRLEEQVHENEEQIEFLTNEKREAARQMREMESIYEAERSAMMKEKDEMANREEEMQTVIQRLKDSLAQRNLDEDRPTRQVTSPGIDSGSFAPPSSIQRSDSRNNSKLLLQKDKMIESLRLELAEAQIKLVESQNQGGGRLQEVERQLMEARVANARLMEDNESYQLLLQDRTLKGDFATSDFSYMGGGSSANQDALAALEGRASGTSLADELSEAGGAPDTHAHDHDAEYRKLESELSKMKDQNKALTLYINKIIERLLQHQEFEHILDTSSDMKGDLNTNKELPPPPGNKQQPPSLLQRAKSIAIGPSAPRPKPRPMTFMPQVEARPTSSAITNPDTAPSIPIGLTRSASTRRGRPMSEQFTGGNAASIVNAMYKGPDGPLSPTLRSSQPFFMPQSGIGGGPGNRASSGSATTPGSGGLPMSTSGNFPGMRSETSSTSGDSVNGGNGEAVGHSPPRAHRDRETTTTFAGNKPRPLRLVQENVEGARNENANKRQSWMGWATSAFGKKDGGENGEAIKE